MSRREAREKAIQALYELEFQQDVVKRIFQEQSQQLAENDFAFFQQLVEGIKTQQADLDEQIQKFLHQRWTIDRISIVDRVILRLAIFEIKYQQDTPFRVVLNEAVDLSKLYGNEESKRFINGLLGKWVSEFQESQNES